MRIDKDNKVTKTIRGKHRSRAPNISKYQIKWGCIFMTRKSQRQTQ